MLKSASLSKYENERNEEFWVLNVFIDNIGRWETLHGLGPTKHQRSIQKKVWWEANFIWKGLYHSYQETFSN
jgi:hypothetical protein